MWEQVERNVVIGKEEKQRKSWRSRLLTWRMAHVVLKVNGILWWIPQVPTSPWLNFVFFSCENNLLLITSWILSPAPMTSQGLSGLSLCASVFVCVCVCEHSLGWPSAVKFWLNEILTLGEWVRSEAFVLCLVGTGPTSSKKSSPHAEQLWHQQMFTDGSHLAGSFARLCLSGWHQGHVEVVTYQI